MKNSSLGAKLMLAALAVAVAIYFIIYAATYFASPFSTAAAYSFTSEDAVLVSGYVVREESPLEGGGDLIYFSRSEGERISDGGTVAAVYDSRQALENANTLRRLERQLQQQQYARSLVGSGQNSGRMEEDVAEALSVFLSALAEDKLSAAIQAGDGLRSAVLRRSYAYTGAEELDRSIAELEETIKTLSAANRDSTTNIRSPRSGLFSSMVDGYEAVLTPERLKDMTAEEYRALAPEEAPPAVGKLITGSKWYFVTLMQEKEAGDLRQGDVVLLRFQTGLELDLEMTVERITKPDQGQCLVVLSSDRYLALTTSLRRQNAQIVFRQYTGIRVPRSAVRILQREKTDEEGEAVLRPDGTAEMENYTGVYCLWGRFARLKPVEILWQEENYLLVQAEEGATEKRRLRAGDEVITAAAELYDGKVIQ